MTRLQRRNKSMRRNLLRKRGVILRGGQWWRKVVWKLSIVSPPLPFSGVVEMLRNVP